MIENVRQRPRQSRSEQTIEDIIEASIQVLERSEEPVFTTTQIAERAGVAVGSLYRYFPDKGALLRFLVLREIERTSHTILSVIETSRATNTDELMTEVIQAGLAQSQFTNRRRALAGLQNQIQNDKALISEVQATRVTILRRLHKRLRTFEPDRFGPLTGVQMHAVANAYRSALITLTPIDGHETTPHKVQSRLVLALMSAMSDGF
jgi:AcrR family transcriptional regulator